MYERSLADLFCIPVCHVCTLIVAVCLLCFMFYNRVPHTHVVIVMVCYVLPDHLFI